jgi:NAD(P)-dependent dehydrogenase (short-subunit alcohol dehydrogenase family)
MSITEMFSLVGKVAVVTGASSGLGVAFARALAEAGADVALGRGALTGWSRRWPTFATRRAAAASPSGPTSPSPRTASG